MLAIICSPMVIPRILHRIWLGDSPLPTQFSHYGDTWVAHHPRWEHRLWTDENLPELTHQDAFDRGANQSERSNILRYELVRQFGGVYVDTDVECLRPIEPLLAEVSAFAAVELGDQVGTAVLGATPEHPVFQLAADSAARAVRDEPTGHKPEVIRTGPTFFTRLVAEREDIRIFGPEPFYPYSHKEKPPVGRPWPEATYAVHHWAGGGQEMLDPHDEIERLRQKLKTSQTRRRETAAQLKRLQEGRWWRLGTAISKGIARLRRAP